MRTKRVRKELKKTGVSFCDEGRLNLGKVIAQEANCNPVLHVKLQFRQKPPRQKKMRFWQKAGSTPQRVQAGSM
jgi:hypothetical protein